MKIKLTGREKEVLEALAQGLSRQGVADALRWEDTTVPEAISDYGVGAHVLGTLAYTAIEQKSWERTGAVAGAYVANTGLNYLVKRLVRRERPNGLNDHSFYSGHTSTAFVGAGAVCLQEQKAACYSALGLAAAIGYLRIAANWHWFSDVAVGAGVGYGMGRLVPTIFVNF